ncbi:RidA family protein [Allofrancisella guangzhouensis]|uniref:Endoribonuclease L-PSP n=1 Tax=Allofrancisella guangzhouensis TaxID=594679 RepID=A0A0A8E6H9_9GAMM|nr:RidA family protein [Allofrancisella guangzhouensis]AJC49197.1 endoribonuclease L-PSP [Allofrancisella guangzhouensis]MBK2027326.1 RidA family protein [Allofrancisella guangzhouensis]MBK2043716.1 RidA family protein [Allofrancisella guangzhouensis]MBK2045308.1 RidA family protein [Allofrancisella guangzhouensis]
MQKNKINTVNAPQAIGAYEQAIVVGNFVYTSGQIGLKPDSNLISKCIKEQTTQVMENLKAVLEAAGSRLDKLVKVTIFIKDMNEFSVINEVYSSFLGSNYPARSCVEVSRLPKDVKIEIEAIAIL